MRSPSLQQIRTACTVVECGFNASRAAATLHTTQPSVSKTLKALEGDLGMAVFLRSSKRIVGLTDFGQDFVGLGHRILCDSAAVIELAHEKLRERNGALHIGTTHTYACFSLPNVVKSFAQDHPNVYVHLDQGDPEQVAEWLALGRVEIGISPVPDEMPMGLVVLPAFTAERCIIAPRAYNLSSHEKLTLADLAKYSLISYHKIVGSGAQIQKILRQGGEAPKVVVKATDASVIKAYVAAGLGIAVLQKIAIEPEDEHKFDVIDASHLFPPATVYLIFRRDRYFRNYVYDFIQAFTPRWTKKSIDHHLSGDGDAVKGFSRVT